MSSPKQYKRIVLNERPIRDFEPGTFRTETVPFDLKPGEAQVLVQTTWLSLDPGMRIFVKDYPSYVPQIQIGEVFIPLNILFRDLKCYKLMQGQGLGIIVQAGPGSILAVGDTVKGRWGMTEYAVVDDSAVQKLVIPQGADALDFLSTLGLSGMSAYFGIKDIGKLKEGELLVVSGAAGSVGTIACQLGKQAGAKVYGIAGSDEKCEWLEKELGVDGVFNYKSPNFREDFKKIGHVDVYFDNVGGGVGFILAEAPPHLLFFLKASLDSSSSYDYALRFPEAVQLLAAGLADGSIKRKFHIVEGGIEQAPVALPLLFSGGNTGKLFVHSS
ncbi:hypothetical protein H0H81_004577 [Sphagnurus paluster]|uniref:Enoyl reductase (ER) domain-containing protein n=1 Tax=Sphagnurus paluster TaxID=117069 RepID=A0A9P7GM18_9AGAR|nr:hypothetical protein H0H81_004577 [Sphagnurus paluster]